MTCFTDDASGHRIADAVAHYLNEQRQGRPLWQAARWGRAESSEGSAAGTRTRGEKEVEPRQKAFHQYATVNTPAATRKAAARRGT